MGGLFGGVGGFLSFAAFALLLVVSVSVPIWDSVRFLRASLPAGELRLGNWGACVAGVCSRRQLGYNLDDIIASASGNGLNNISGSVVRGLTYALVLHPIAAALALVAFLLAVCPTLVSHVLGSIVASFALLVTIVVFGIDLGLFITARNRIRSAGFSAELGNAIWMVLAATVALLIASFTICCAGISDRRSRRSSTNAYNDPMYNEKRGPFWRRRRSAVV